MKELVLLSAWEPVPGMCLVSTAQTDVTTCFIGAVVFGANCRRCTCFSTIHSFWRFI